MVDFKDLAQVQPCEGFGLVGNGAANDAAALASAISAAAGTPRRTLVLKPDTTYGVNLSTDGNIGTCGLLLNSYVRIEGRNTTIKALTAGESVVDIGAGSLEVVGVTFDGNRLANRSASGCSSGRSKFRRCTFTQAVVDGWYSPPTTSEWRSDYIEFDSCKFWDNGRAVGHGSYGGVAIGNLGASFVDSHDATVDVSIGDATGHDRYLVADFSESIADTGVRHGDPVVLGAEAESHIWGWVRSVVSDTQITVFAESDDPLTFTGTDLDWIIGRGDGAYFGWHSDNNMEFFRMCQFGYNAGFGLGFAGLYGSTLQHCSFIASNLGGAVRIGRGENAPVFGFHASQLYAGDNAGGFDLARPNFAVVAGRGMSVHYAINESGSGVPMFADMGGVNSGYIAWDTNINLIGSTTVESL